ncbi:MAG: cation transporter [Clostridia bacterium]|nr:cation transporter [Clostridia bacterium]
MAEIIKIEGMGCQRCVDSVTAALEATEGVKVLKVEIGSAEVELADDAARAAAKAAIEDRGFDVV